jgi:hypothetical protein
VTHLFLCTTITRRGTDGTDVICDMLIRFRVTSYVPGCPEVRYQRNGDPGWPAESAEYEFEVESIEFDSGRAYPNTPPDDAPWPLTDDEDAILRQWFDAAYDQACTVADDNWDDGPDPDRQRDERRDREMEDRDWKEAAE